MRRAIVARLWIVLSIIGLVSGCGNSANDGEKKSTPEAVKAAYDLLRKGEVEKLKVMLVEDPSIANTLYRTDSLLNLVIDTRPEYPRMMDSITVLLESGADPNLNAPELLRKAIWRQEPEIYKLLLDHGADHR